MEQISASLKAHLMSNDQEFNELAAEHGKYEERLRELAALHFPTEEEQLEETLLKKKKLLVKDKMEAIIGRYRRQAVAK